MKMTKATREDFENVLSFLNACELALDDNKFSMLYPQDNWEELDEDDEDAIAIQKIKKSLEEDEGEVDNRILMYEFLLQKFKTANCSWRRVYWAADILIENCCDPLDDCLAFLPGTVFNHVENEM